MSALFSNKRIRIILFASAVVLLAAMTLMAMALPADFEKIKDSGELIMDEERESGSNIVESGPVTGGVNTTPDDYSDYIVDDTVPIYISPGVSVYVNGEYVIFPDEQPFINKDGRTMVPIRFISEELGADVGWEQLTKKVSISLNDIDIFLWISSKKYKVAGVEKAMDTMPILQKGRTFVPIRFIAEAFGAEVGWDGTTRTVTVDMR